MTKWVPLLGPSKWVMLESHIWPAHQSNKELMLSRTYVLEIKRQKQCQFVRMRGRIIAVANAIDKENCPSESGRSDT